MALSTYSELQSAIADWINRDDLTTQILDFIRLAETRLNAELRLRLMESNQSLTLASGASTISLPSGYVEPLALWIVKATGRKPLAFVAPGSMNTLASSGEPEKWTISGSTIAFDRLADANYSILFRMTSGYTLSDAAPTNDLLTKYPNAYLFGALIEAADFMKDGELLATASARFADAVETIKRIEGRSKALGTLRLESQMLPRPYNYGESNEG